jgi:hypothetical protein
LSMSTAWVEIDRGFPKDIVAAGDSRHYIISR